MRSCGRPDSFLADSVIPSQALTFYRERFRDEFKPAFEAWQAMDPLRNPQAPPTPFRLPQYRVHESLRAADLAKEADRLFDLGRQANQQGDNYVLTSVVLSSVLFLGGIASNFDRRAVRGGMMTIAAILLAIGLHNIVTFPVA